MQSAEERRTRLRSALKECADARRKSDPERCLVHARSALGVCRYNVKAHKNWIWSLFALRKYELCREECDKSARVFSLYGYNDVALVPVSWEERKRERLQFRRMQHASLICERLQQRHTAAENQNVERNSSNNSVTERLQNEWYASCLQRKIENGQLERFTDPNNPWAPHLPGNIVRHPHPDECCIVQMKEGQSNNLVLRDNGEWWIEVQLEGGERRIQVSSVLSGFPLDQAVNGNIYLKHRIMPRHECGENRRRDGFQWPCETCMFYQLPYPLYPFPRWEPQPDSDGLVQTGVTASGQSLDVYYGSNLVPDHVKLPLRDLLDRLARLRRDFPVPKYQNIIDPNIGALDGIWIATEFEISEVQSPTSERLMLIELAGFNSLGEGGGNSMLPPTMAHSILSYEGPFPKRANVHLCSSIPDVDPHSHAALYIAVEQVMEAAVPLLCKLKRPSLLLPGPLQAVVKAQRVILGPGESYQGLWHDEGLNEHIVAVVLYYYRVSDSLKGGDMELASKKKTVVDTWGPYPAFHEHVSAFPRCKVPIQEGTMLVFSNYELVHRVLEMQCTESEREVGFRDFLAFFIVDQRHPLSTPSELPPVKMRKEERMTLLQQQLTARGKFGLSGDEVYSTGNGSVSDLGWIQGNCGSDNWVSPTFARKLVDSVAFSKVMNAPSNIFGRGISGSDSLAAAAGEVLVDFDAGSPWSQVCVGVGKSDDVGTPFADLLVFFLNRESFQFVLYDDEDYPQNQIDNASAYKMFESMISWQTEREEEEAALFWSHLGRLNVDSTTDEQKEIMRFYLDADF